MVLFRITENEPSKMHVRPYVYSRPWYTISLLILLEVLLEVTTKLLSESLSVFTYFISI